MKIRLSSYQIMVLETLARERDRYVRSSLRGVIIYDFNFNYVKSFKRPTFDFMVKHDILIMKNYQDWILNPEIKGWDFLKEHLHPEINPKVNWYNNV